MGHWSFKILLFFFVNIVAMGVLPAQRISNYEVAVLSSEINILGETNVNKFGCELFISTITDSLKVKSEHSVLSIAFDSLILIYHVQGFDCGLSAMTEDFRSILKANDYPHLLLQINQININPDSKGFERVGVTADVTVTIAGQSRDLLIFDSYVINETDQDLTLHGTETVRMTDFNIDPPIRFWGALRVYDQLTIIFNIQMHVATK
ncbi:MAG: hypothetical protein ACI8TA_002478 [Cyclobacteriaceae bacterium]|jgi:hypothetical protein